MIIYEVWEQMVTYRTQNSLICQKIHWRGNKAEKSNSYRCVSQSKPMIEP